MNTTTPHNRPGTAETQIPVPASGLAGSRDLVLGIGCDRNTPYATLAQVIDEALAQLQASWADVRAVASIDLKADEVAMRELQRQRGHTIHFYPATWLAQVPVPNPSETVRKYTGTPSVSEAAALLVAGDVAQALAHAVPDHAPARVPVPPSHAPQEAPVPVSQRSVSLPVGGASRRNGPAPPGDRSPYMNPGDILQRPGCSILRCPVHERNTPPASTMTPSKYPGNPAR